MATKTSLYLSDDGRAFQLALSKHLGVSQTDVVEQALRLLARREQIAIEEARKVAQHYAPKNRGRKD